MKGDKPFDPFIIQSMTLDLFEHKSLINYSICSNKAVLLIPMSQIMDGWMDEEINREIVD